MTDLVQIRTPTYRRPEALRRCLEGLRAQTHGNWICEVYDDDPEESARPVVQGHDDRIRYIPNRPQLYASANIDQCFRRENPNGAAYFCVVEDDNQILPTFLAANIAALRASGAKVLLRNQLVEWASGTPRARLSDFGILDGKYTERVYDPATFRLAILADIGVSNGGLFWTHDARTEMEIAAPVSATLLEYARTFALADPIQVALEPLAIWAANEGQTNRDLGLGRGYLRRELLLKRSVQILQWRAWQAAPEATRQSFLDTEIFGFPRTARAEGLVKSLIRPERHSLSARRALELTARGLLIRLAGRPEPGLAQFIARAEATWPKG